VAYVTSDNKPAGSTQVDKYVLGGVTRAGPRARRGRAHPQGRHRRDPRCQPSAQASGEEVFKAQCTTCHTAGVAGAPKFGDAAAGQPHQDRLRRAGAVRAEGQGRDAAPGRRRLRATPKIAVPWPTWPTPAAPSSPNRRRPAAQAAGAAAAGPRCGRRTCAPPPCLLPARCCLQLRLRAARPPLPPAAAAGNGEALYKQACVACHAAGVAGAPKFGDKAAWAPARRAGHADAVQSASRARARCRPRVAAPRSDAEIKAAVDYMVGAAK
jgi:cytochrome c5